VIIVANWADVVYLVSVKETQDSDGFLAIVEGEPKLVFANKKSIRSQEFYLAKQSGIELSFMFDVRSVDYEGEEKLLFESNEFIIERIYEKGEFTELVCKRKDDDHA
jgi:Holliday junction resolvase-like predicted endonuclease